MDCVPEKELDRTTTAKEETAITEERRQNANQLPKLLAEVCRKVLWLWTEQIECCKKTMIQNMAANYVKRGNGKLKSLRWKDLQWP